MKIYVLLTVLLVALVVRVHETESLKVLHADTNSLPGNIQQQGAYQTGTSGALNTKSNAGVASPNTGSNAGDILSYNSYQPQQQQQQQQTGSYGSNTGQESLRASYQYTNPTQPTTQQAQAQPQYYYNHYYPHQNAQFALGKTSSDQGQGGAFGLGSLGGGGSGGFGLGSLGGGGNGGFGLGGLGGHGDGGGGGSDGILGSLTSVFTDLLGMLGMGMDDDQNTHMGAGGYSGGGNGWPQSMDGGGGGGGGAGGGIGGSIGGGLGGIILGKKAGWLKGIILAPILLPLIALVIAVIVAIILIIPVPVIEGKRSAPSTIWSPVESTMNLARSVLQSDECVERVSCEIARLAKSYVPDEWVDRKLESYNNKWLHRISRSIKTARSNSSCSQYSCSTFTFPLQKIRSYLTPNKKSGSESRASGSGARRASSPKKQ